MLQFHKSADKIFNATNIFNLHDEQEFFLFLRARSRIITDFDQIEKQKFEDFNNF